MVTKKEHKKGVMATTKTSDQIYYVIIDACHVTDIFQIRVARGLRLETSNAIWSALEDKEVLYIDENGRNRKQKLVNKQKLKTGGWTKVLI